MLFNKSTVPFLYSRWIIIIIKKKALKVRVVSCSSFGSRIQTGKRHPGLEQGSRGWLQWNTGERRSLQPSLRHQLVLVLRLLAAVRPFLPPRSTPVPRAKAASGTSGVWADHYWSRCVSSSNLPSWKTLPPQAAQFTPHPEGIVL